jgi:hypothetical protein
MTERLNPHDGIRGPVIALFNHPPRSHTAMMNRVTTLFLSVALATATVAGCDSKSDAKPDDKKAADKKDVKTPDAKTPAADVKTPEAPAGDVKAPEAGDPAKAPEAPAGDVKAPEAGDPAKAPEAPAGDVKAPAAEPTK